MTTKTKTVKLSRKARVKDCFERHGTETAWTLGQKLKLKVSTLSTWLSGWRREQEAARRSRRRVKAKAKSAAKAATAIAA